MDKQTKTYLIYGGAVVIASIVFGYIYSARKYKKRLDNSLAKDEAEETPTSQPQNANPFTSMLNNPPPASVGYSFDLNKYLLK